jgi:hypothetical protein
MESLRGNKSHTLVTVGVQMEGDSSSISVVTIFAGQIHGSIALLVQSQLLLKAPSTEIVKIDVNCRQRIIHEGSLFVICSTGISVMGEASSKPENSEKHPLDPSNR